ncbi:MAG: hypothetical protein HYZ53_10450 [Planctomycetes bacterium]|nr:hypothetical protein [Planctomycetota bacterium]
MNSPCRLRRAGDTGVAMSEYLRFEGSGSALSADAQRDNLVGDDGRRIGLAARRGAQARVADGRFGWEYNIPIPFTNYSFRSQAGTSGTYDGVGAAAGGHAYYDRSDGRFHLGALLDVEVILGVGIDGDLSFGRRPTSR